jgi:cell division septation protein DedD
MRIFLLILLSVFIIQTVETKADNDRIRYYLQLVAQGKIDEVKRDLPDLLIDYPDDPGIQLLHAVVVADIFKAVQVYERIVTNYPTSEFADDAYWRIVQFYAVKGDTTSAQKVMDMYREAFPDSPYLITAAEAIRAAKGVSKTSGRTTILKLTGKKTEPKKVSPKKTEKQHVTIVPASTQTQTTQPSATAHKVKTAQKTGHYGLQVGLYSTVDAAESEVERFRDMRLKADIVIKEINGVKRYAVVIGDYSTRESAEAAKNIVQEQCNCTPLIFEK